jgi:hypothetical protein
MATKIVGIGRIVVLSIKKRLVCAAMVTSVGLNCYLILAAIPLKTGGGIELRNRETTATVSALEECNPFHKDRGLDCVHCAVRRGQTKSEWMLRVSPKGTIPLLQIRDDPSAVTWNDDKISIRFGPGGSVLTIDTSSIDVSHSAPEVPL